MENISWTTFGIGMTLIVLCYYLPVIIYCYGPELRKIIPQNSNDNYNPLFINEEENSSGNAVEEEAWQESASETQEVDNLIEALKEGIGFASDHEYQPLAFKAHLASIIQKFPNLQGSGFQPAINELIVNECKEYGVIKLNEEETMLLWNNNK
jgi:hypothetical protein